MKGRLYRIGSWGDRRHWELYVGGLTISRWCEGAPCHLPVDGRHPVSAMYRRRR